MNSDQQLAELEVILRGNNTKEEHGPGNPENAVSALAQIALKLLIVVTLAAWIRPTPVSPDIRQILLRELDRLEQLERSRMALDFFYDADKGVREDVMRLVLKDGRIAGDSNSYRFAEGCRLAQTVFSPEGTGAVQNNWSQAAQDYLQSQYPELVKREMNTSGVFKATIAAWLKGETEKRLIKMREDERRVQAGALANLMAYYHDNPDRVEGRDATALRDALNRYSNVLKALRELDLEPSQPDSSRKDLLETEETNLSVLVAKGLTDYVHKVFEDGKAPLLQ